MHTTKINKAEPLASKDFRFPKESQKYFQENHNIHIKYQQFDYLGHQEKHMGDKNE